VWNAPEFARWTSVVCAIDRLSLVTSVVAVRRQNILRNMKSETVNILTHTLP
jgi:hypothetical protein